jgi:hypothetical protein
MAVLDRPTKAPTPSQSAASRRAERKLSDDQDLIIAQLDATVASLSKARESVQRLRAQDPKLAAAYVEAIQDTLVELLDI